MLGQKLQASALGRRAEEREVLPMFMARISTSMDKVFAKKPHRQSYNVRACPAGDTLKKWFRGREGTDDRKGLMTGAGQRAPGQGAEGDEGDAGMVKQGCSCTVPNPEEGLRGEAVHTGDRQGKDHRQVDVCFFS